jgi:ribosomal protein S27AE
MGQKQPIKQGEPIYLCHDESCPNCGFPETLNVLNDEMTLMRRICSKRCGWEISAEELLALNDDE